LHDLEVDFLSFDQVTHTRTLDGRNMDKNVRLPVAQLDKAESFGGIEELNRSSGHSISFQTDIHHRRLAGAKRREFRK
jgi:hypothetical protein